MQIDQSYLESERTRLTALRDQLIAQVNAVGGALELITAQLAKLAEPEKPAEKKP